MKDRRTQPMRLLGMPASTDNPKETTVSYREPMFLITDDAGGPLGAVAVEAGRWIGRDTAGRKLFNRKNLSGATVAARPIGQLVSTAWYGIRGARPGETRSERIRHDRRGLPYVADPWPMYVTRCCAATVTITIDDGALCCRACYQEVDHRLAWDPDLSQPADGETSIDTSGSGPVHARPQEAAAADSRPSAYQDPSSRNDPHDAADQSPSP